MRRSIGQNTAEPQKEDRPVDLFGTFTPPEFPVDLMPAPVRDYARDQAELIGVDPAVISLGCLAVIAGALDDRIKIQPKRHDPTWTESARLWIGIIGDPSAMKSPGLKKATGPINKVAAKRREEYNKKLAKWQKKIENLEKGEEKPKPPKMDRITAGDVTVETLGDILSKCEPRGILIERDELTAWLQSMDAYKNGAGGKDKAAWLEAYNGGGLEIDRINRGSLFVPNWSASVVGGIQPQVIHSYANSGDHDGMLQRFMLIHAAPARRGVDRLPDMTAKDNYETLIRKIVDTKPPFKGHVTLSDEAHEVRESFEDKLHKAITSPPNPHLTAMLGKWRGLFARVCLAFHAAECADNSVYPTAEQVSAETAEKVYRLLWHTMLPHAIEFYDGLDITEDHARKIAGLILARGWERFTVKRDLMQNMAAFRKLKDWEKKESLDRLESYALIEPEEAIDERGRPLAYSVNPQVHELYRENAEKERDRRQATIQLMAELKT